MPKRSIEAKKKKRLEQLRDAQRRRREKLKKDSRHFVQIILPESTLQRLRLIIMASGETMQEAIARVVLTGLDHSPSVALAETRSIEAVPSTPPSVATDPQPEPPFVADDPSESSPPAFEHAPIEPNEVAEFEQVSNNEVYLEECVAEDTSTATAPEGEERAVTGQIPKDEQLEEDLPEPDPSPLPEHTGKPGASTVASGQLDLFG